MLATVVQDPEELKKRRVGASVWRETGTAAVLDGCPRPIPDLNTRGPTRVSGCLCDPGLLRHEALYTEKLFHSMK